MQEISDKAKKKKKTSWISLNQEKAGHLSPMGLLMERSSEYFSMMEVNLGASAEPKSIVNDNREANKFKFGMNMLET